MTIRHHSNQRRLDLKQHFTREVQQQNSRVFWLITLLLLAVIGFVLLNLGFSFNPGDTSAQYGRRYEESAQISWYGHNLLPIAKITGNIDTNKIGTQQITFKVAGKTFTKSVEVADTEPPSIIVVNNENCDESGNLTLSSIEDFVEPGVFAVDNYDSNVNVQSTLEQVAPSDYVVRYTATDSNNNTNIVERKVHIYRGDVYLTFDDGPYFNVTSQILDILDANDVKATFFLLGYTHGSPDEEMVKRAYESGHTIGMHGYSHSYKEVYASSMALYGNYTKIATIIEETLGFVPKYIRFPGGSSNTVSKNYCPGIMTWASQNLTDYVYFDWNVDGDDAGGAVGSAEDIFFNVTSTLHKGTNVVILHDGAGHQATVDALQMIINFCLENGYVLKPITESTPVVQHKINN